MPTFPYNCSFRDTVRFPLESVMPIIQATIQYRCTIVVSSPWRIGLEYMYQMRHPLILHKGESTLSLVIMILR